MNQQTPQETTVENTEQTMDTSTEQNMLKSKNIQYILLLLIIILLGIIGFLLWTNTNESNDDQNDTNTSESNTENESDSTIDLEEEDQDNEDSESSSDMENTEEMSASEGTSVSYPLFFTNAATTDDFADVLETSRSTDRSDAGTFLVEQLFAGPTPSEQSSGMGPITSFEFRGSSNCGGENFTLEVSDSIATLQFCRDTFLVGDITPDFTVPLQETLTQFSTVDRVIVLDKNGDCWNDLSGTGEACAR